jgi:hypothetical protein
MLLTKIPRPRKAGTAVSKSLTLSIVLTTLLVANTSAQFSSDVVFDQYDLFKNSGFSLCEIAYNGSTTAAQPIGKRTPKSSGGHSSSKSNSDEGIAGTALISNLNLGKTANYCSNFDGIPVS